MSEFWEDAFVSKQLMWGLGPSRSALFARDHFVRIGAKDVLMPGIGYGRNAKALIDAGMSVTGIEISGTAIELARAELGLDIPIHHGSVTDMPFDDKQYDAVFCYGLLYLLDATGRAKVLRECSRQLKPGGEMIFSVISKRAPMYGQGELIGEDWYRMPYGVNLFFYDTMSIGREFGPYGLREVSEVDEPTGGTVHSFINVVCARP
jgi:SAM-dependent methyltransferase